MRNITGAVSGDSYRQARIWAAKNGTSVSAARDLLLSPGSRRNGEITHPLKRPFFDELFPKVTVNESIS
jgi:hypothetical protein